MTSLALQDYGRADLQNPWRSSIAALSASIVSLVFLSVGTVGAGAHISSDIRLIDNSVAAATKRTSKEDTTSAITQLKKGLISGAATRVAKELVLHPIETVKCGQVTA